MWIPGNMQRQWVWLPVLSIIMKQSANNVTCPDVAGRNSSHREQHLSFILQYLLPGAAIIMDHETTPIINGISQAIATSLMILLSYNLDVIWWKAINIGQANGSPLFERNLQPDFSIKIVHLIANIIAMPHHINILWRAPPDTFHQCLKTPGIRQRIPRSSYIGAGLSLALALAWLVISRRR